MRTYFRYALLVLAIALSIAGIIKASTEINEQATTPEMKALVQELVDVQKQAQELPTMQSKIDFAIDKAFSSSLYQKALTSIAQSTVEGLVKKADTGELVGKILEHENITSAQRPGSRDFTDEEKAKLTEFLKTAIQSKQDRFPVIATEHVRAIMKSRADELVKIWKESSWIKTFTFSGFTQLVDRVKQLFGVKKVFEDIANEWSEEVATEMLELGGKDIIRPITTDGENAEAEKPAELNKRFIVFIFLIPLLAILGPIIAIEVMVVLTVASTAITVGAVLLSPVLVVILPPFFLFAALTSPIWFPVGIIVAIVVFLINVILGAAGVIA
ncbi:hypothetical protein HK102_001349 [Quaeritorhiza haematococci]|nr:hypothetical protein HK102_001349 [Quaeritorhiza haematococci]